MHEMGIACSILEAVENEGLRYPGCRPVRVGVRIGRFAGVDGCSLRFCFDAMVMDSERAGLELQVLDGGSDELDLAWVEFDDSARNGIEVAA
jgi:Zn finger protein HypA/HybF involved in hydrogenase expression